MNIQQTVIPSFTFLSHHPKDRHTSPCTSVYQAFIGPNRIAELGGYVQLMQEREKFKAALSAQMDRHQPHFLFNGFQSLLLDTSIMALSTALANAIPVTIYWHETAWNLRQLAEKQPKNFKKARELLHLLNVENWVPTSQCLHAVATMMGFPLDTFRIVYEVVDLDNFTVNAKRESKSNDEPLVIAGAGVPDERKGIDIFSYLAKAVPALIDRKVEFRWYAATKSRETNLDVPYPKSIKWMGHQTDFQNSLKDVDIFVLTSRDDPSPLVVFEALASGHPAFAFATTGFNEMLPPEYVALDPDDMCQRLASLAKNFIPNPEKYRAIAENYSVEHFRDRAFRNRHAIVRNLPDHTGEILDLYVEEDAPTLDDKLENLRKMQGNIFRMMKTAQRQRINADARALRLDHVTRERDEAKIISRRLANELKLEYFRENRRAARSARKKSLALPFFSQQEPQKLNVLVIGNAPSVLDRELGHRIDQFDVVIRINNFRIQGYEKQIGSKTDYALISPACMPSSELSALPASKVFVFGANLRDDYEKIKSRLSDKSRGCQIVPPAENILKSAIYVDAMRLEMDFDLTSDQWPSTGIVAVQWARDMHGKAAKVHVHGFDFYSDNRHTLTRYFDVTTKADGKHDFDREKLHLQQMVDKGLIVRL